MRLTGKRALLLVGAAVLVAAASVGYAAVASSSGVISACMLKATGTIRLLDPSAPSTSLASRPCSATLETPVSWNEQGVKGDTGPRGPAGSTQADERFYVARLADISTWLHVTSTDVHAKTHVTGMHLDEGNYVITTEVIAGNYTGRGVLVCTTGNATVGVSVGQSAVGNAPGYSIQQTLQSQSIFTVPAGGTDIELACFNAPQGTDAPGDPIVGLGDLIATKVDTATSDFGS